MRTYRTRHTPNDPAMTGPASRSGASSTAIAATALPPRRSRLKAVLASKRDRAPIDHRVASRNEATASRCELNALWPATAVGSSRSGRSLRRCRLDLQHHASLLGAPRAVPHPRRPAGVVMRGEGPIQGQVVHCAGDDEHLLDVRVDHRPVTGGIECRITPDQPGEEARLGIPREQSLRHGNWSLRITCGCHATRLPSSPRVGRDGPQVRASCGWHPQVSPQ
jgi:hypothetical protein